VTVLGRVLVQVLTDDRKETALTNTFGIERARVAEAM
jgi:hypothetical protein